MENPVSAYCVHCDKWFPLDPEDQAKLRDQNEVPCEVCGAPMRLSHPNPWMRMADRMRSVFRRPRQPQS